MDSKWLVGGKLADQRDLMESTTLARQHRRREAELIREIQERDRNAELVGAALRRAARKAKQLNFPIRCFPSFTSGTRKGSTRIRKFETLVGLSMPLRKSHIAVDGYSEFHCKFTSRGLGNKRTYKAKEVVRTFRYIARESARELENGGLISNISRDLDETASVLAALEELEVAAAAKNANVYMTLVVSLPHELTADERLDALRDICMRFEMEELPFAAVLHAPDPDGDQRNYHAHIVFSLRPFRRNEDGSYSFAASKASDLNDASFIKPFRAHVSNCLNAAMRDAGHSRRFTPLSRKDRGLQPSKSKSKRRPGEKDQALLADNVARASTELEWLGAFQKAQVGLSESARAIVASHPLDRAAIIANFSAAEQRIRTEAEVASAATIIRVSDEQSGITDAVQSQAGFQPSTPTTVVAHAQHVRTLPPRTPPSEPLPVLESPSPERSVAGPSAGETNDQPSQEDRPGSLPPAHSAGEAGDTTVPADTETSLPAPPVSPQKKRTVAEEIARAAVLSGERIQRVTGPSQIEAGIPAEAVRSHSPERSVAGPSAGKTNDQPSQQDRPGSLPPAHFAGEARDTIAPADTETSLPSSPVLPQKKRTVAEETARAAVLSGERIQRVTGPSKIEADIPAEAVRSQSQDPRLPNGGSRPEVATDSGLNRERQIRTIISEFRRSAAYRDLDQVEFDEALQAPVRALAEGTATILVTRSGDLKAGGSTEHAIRLIQTFAKTPAGWLLLSVIAESISFPEQSSYGFLPLTSPVNGGEDPTQALSRSRDDGGRG